MTTTGRRCPVPLCPSATLWKLPGELAAHLVHPHEWDGHKAMARAREYLAEPADLHAAPVLPLRARRGRPPRKPQAKESRSRTCNYCHRKDGTHTPHCKRRGKGERVTPSRSTSGKPKEPAGWKDLDHAIEDAERKIALWTKVRERAIAFRESVAEAARGEL